MANAQRVCEEGRYLLNNSMTTFTLWLFQKKAFLSRESLYSGEMHDTSLANRCLLDDASVQRSGYDFRCRFTIAGCVSALASVEIQQTILRALPHVSLIKFA